MNIVSNILRWLQNLSTTKKVSLGGAATCLVLTLMIFGPGGLLHRLTSPSIVEEPAEFTTPEAIQEAALPKELSPEKNAAFLAANAKKDGVVTTATGLQFHSLRPGTGKQPGPTSRVTVHYTGKLINNKVFDSSVGGDPATFILTRVIAAWTEGLQLMKEGEKAELVVPQEIGYGEEGSPPVIPPYQTLVFEVELIKVQ